MAEQEAQTAQHVEAVAALFAERYGQMVGYARKLLRRYGVPPSTADPEDVVQTAFALVLARTEPIGKLRPYVFTVIRHEVGHAIRRHSTGQPYGRLDKDVQLEAVGPTVDPCGTVDLRLDLEAALGELPLQQCRAVLYHKALGLTQADTATIMRVAPGTVATQVSRAVVTLRVTLGALGLVLVACGTALVWGGTKDILPAADFERLGGTDKLMLTATVLAFAVVVLFVMSYVSARPGREIRTVWQRLGVGLRAFLQRTFGAQEYDYTSSTSSSPGSGFSSSSYSGGGGGGRSFETGITGGAPF